MRIAKTPGAVACALLLGAGAALPATAEAQGPNGRWPLQPSSGVGRIVAPFMEGWYDNGDGTYTISFGYLNLNSDAVEIPRGEDNRLEPATYDGVQPTTFLPGRHRGVFAVTVPASEREQDVWWTIHNLNGEVTRVPGRTTVSAYMLDWIPRPHGSLPPVVSFEEGGPEGKGPPGIVAERTLTAQVGTPLTVSLHVRDASPRDETDSRFFEAVPTHVEFGKYAGPEGGEVEFTRHESTWTPPPDEGGGRGRGRGMRREPPTHEVTLPQGSGVARVIVTFSEPGEYTLLAQVDNYDAPDSAAVDQCCWTNAYVRVRVTP